MFERSAIVAAHPDDEVLWFSSVLDKVEKVIICFLAMKWNPKCTRGRQKTLTEHPVKNISCLSIDESDSFNRADWHNPLKSEFGLEISAKDSAVKSYRENYREISRRLRSELQGAGNVFAHNPWGEYGNEEHVQVYRALKHLQGELGFDLWFPNYCGSKAAYLMSGYDFGGAECITMKTNLPLANRIKELYMKNGCWTWYEDWGWAGEETFISDKCGRNVDGARGRIYPLNFIDTGPIPKKNRKSRLLSTSKKMLGIFK